ncbi:MAG: hypothetical protein KAT18_07005 [Candidatus Latescibacteria bacterium]|nr:hypothetical protein [Candidatus Latescibacterota bacterium]
MSRYPVFDPSGLKTRPLSERSNRVSVTDFLPLPQPQPRELVEKRLPDILNGKALKDFARSVRLAGERGRPVIWMMGAHVIKVGCSSLVIDLAERGIISCVATNGAGMIHDFEIALIGATSEDVADNLERGEFGMWQETGSHLHEAARRAQEDGLGYGEGVGRYIDGLDPPHKEASLLWRLWKAGVPVTIHSAIGTDIIHQHPEMDGALVGALTYRDFLIFTAHVADLVPGSVVLNVGSAVLMPEVFVKALAMARNAGHEARGFHSANFDMYDHYRPRVNVVARPTVSGGTGHVFLGQHEVLLPTLYELVVAEPAPFEDDLE